MLVKAAIGHKLSSITVMPHGYHGISDNHPFEYWSWHQRNIKWPHYWPLVKGIHRWVVDSHRKTVRNADTFSIIWSHNDKELLNQWTLTFSPVSKTHILVVWVRYFVWNFKGYPSKSHKIYMIRILKTRFYTMMIFEEVLNIKMHMQADNMAS